MSPEQAKGKPVDRRSDVYSLGVVLWELLTMRKRFDATNNFTLLREVRNPEVVRASDLMPGIPPALDDALGAALRPNPEERPASANAFRNMLAQAVPGALTMEVSTLAELVALVVEEERASTSASPLSSKGSGRQMGSAPTLRLLTGEEPILQTLSLVAPLPAAELRVANRAPGHSRLRHAIGAVVSVAIVAFGLGVLALSRRARTHEETNQEERNPTTIPEAMAAPLAPPVTSPSGENPAPGIATSGITASNGPLVRPHPRKPPPRPETGARPSASAPSVRIIQGVPIVEPK
jgi:serine/threonine-protein kinase